MILFLIFISRQLNTRDLILAIELIFIVHRHNSYVSTWQYYISVAIEHENAQHFTRNLFVGRFFCHFYFYAWVTCNTILRLFRVFSKWVASWIWTHISHKNTIYNVVALEFCNKLDYCRGEKNTRLGNNQLVPTHFQFKYNLYLAYCIWECSCSI